PLRRNFFIKPLYRYINREKITRVVTKLGLTDIILNLLPKDTIIKIQHSVPSSAGRIEIAKVLEMIDWKNTEAVCVAENCVYVTSSNPEKIIEELKRELVKIKSPLGESAVKDVKEGKSVYWGDSISDVPDLIIVPEEGYRFYDGVAEGLWDANHTDGWHGYHKLHGIFLAKGPGIKKGVKIEGAKIYDIAPTILHIFGVPVPRDMDGRVLTELFEEGSELAKRKPVYVDPSHYDRENLKRKTKEQIKKLKKRKIKL
ncbi:MAG: hypothetical protein D6808_03855, partial [Candidatus Dadabacteria bacterium]